ncbi:hypothetical protein Tco_1369121 [Tanacetum coccineum]
MPTIRQGLSSAAIEQLIAQRVADALTAYEANQNSGTGVKDETSGSAGGAEHTTRGCSCKEFLTCKPHNFNRTEGGLDQVVRAKAAKSVDNKRKWDDNQRGNLVQQQNKRQEVVRAFTVRLSVNMGDVLVVV